LIIKTDGNKSFLQATEDTDGDILTLDLANARMAIATDTADAPLDIVGSNSAGIRIRGVEQEKEIADMYLGTEGQLVINTTAGTDTDGYIDIRTEDDGYGVVLRESDGSGTTVFANLFVKDDTKDYLNIVVSANNGTPGLCITEDEYVGIQNAAPTCALDVSGDFLLSGAAQGIPQSLGFTRLASTGISGATHWMQIGTIVTSVAKGFRAIRNGSIVGMSVQYDVTVENNSPALYLVAVCGGVEVWVSDALTTTVGTERGGQFTQARGTDTFSAGDVFTLALKETAGGGNSITVDDVVCIIEFYYDT